MNEVKTSLDKAVTTSAPKSISKRIVTGFGFGLFAVFALTIYAYTAFKSVVVSGESMLPTFTSGTRLLVSNAYWLVGPIKDKDIVVIKDNNVTGYIIKRVYKLGGETVDWYNVPKDWSLEAGEYKVPANHVYVLGDNRAVSEDSRAFGPVDESRILGKVVLRPTKRSN